MKVEEIFPNTSDFTEILTDAVLNASNDWEIDFVSDIEAKWEKYGAKLFITGKQLDKLSNLAQGVR